MAAAVRAFFAAKSFVEVDTAILQVSPGNEAHISAFATMMQDETGAGSPLYLHSSPEFASKKLLAAGEERIFTLAHVFRKSRKRPPAPSRIHFARMVQGSRALSAAH